MDALFTKMVKFGKIVYFIDVKEGRGDEKYINVIRSQPSEKDPKVYAKTAIQFKAGVLPDFIEALAEASEHVLGQKITTAFPRSDSPVTTVMQALDELREGNDVGAARLLRSLLGAERCHHHDAAWGEADLSLKSQYGYCLSCRAAVKRSIEVGKTEAVEE